MDGSIILLAIVLIMAGCAVFLFLKGTFIRAFATAITAVCSSAVALGFFGILANTLVNLGGGSSLLTRWAEPLCFILLFIVAFAVMQTVVNLLTKRPIDLGLWPERIGRAACGAFLGFTLSRVLFAALIMTFLPSLQTNSLGKYLGYKGINPPKQTQPKQTERSSAKREAGPQKESKKTPKEGKLSDTSKSVLGPDFE